MMTIMIMMVMMMVMMRMMMKRRNKFLAQCFCVAYVQLKDAILFTKVFLDQYISCKTEHSARAFLHQFTVKSTLSSIDIPWCQLSPLLAKPITRGIDCCIGCNGPILAVNMLVCHQNNTLTH